MLVTQVQAAGPGGADQQIEVQPLEPAGDQPRHQDQVHLDPDERRERPEQSDHHRPGGVFRRVRAALERHDQLEVDKPRKALNERELAAQARQPPLRCPFPSVRSRG